MCTTVNFELKKKNVHVFWPQKLAKIKNGNFEEMAKKTKKAKTIGKNKKWQ